MQAYYNLIVLLLPLPLPTCCISRQSVLTSHYFFKTCISKDPVMENIWTLVFNTNATEALSGYRHIAEILTSCHTITQKHPNWKEYWEYSWVSWLFVTMYFVKCPEEIATFFSLQQVNEFKRTFNYSVKKHLPVRYGAGRQPTPSHFLPFSYCFLLVCLLTVCNVSPLFLLPISFY